MRRPLLFFPLLVAAALLVGCGQKGPLVRAPAKPNVPAPAVPPSGQAAPTANPAPGSSAAEPASIP